MGLIARWIVVAVAAATCSGALTKWAWVPLRSSIQLTELTRRTDGAAKTGDDYQRTVRARNNTRDLAALRASAPTDVRVLLLLAVNYELLGQRENVLRTYDEAIRVEARPEIYVSRGDALLTAGRIEDAIDSYAAALRFDPVYIYQIAPVELHDRIRERAARRRP